MDHLAKRTCYAAILLFTAACGDSKTALPTPTDTASNAGAAPATEATNADAAEPALDAQVPSRQDGGKVPDGAVDCRDTVNTPRGPVARACIHEIPLGASARWDFKMGFPEALRVEAQDGGRIASYETSCCNGTDLIPAGADPQTWQPQGSIHAADYDRSCQQDADCTLVFDGDLSLPCLHCASAAIRATAQPAYLADLVQKRGGGTFPAACNCGAVGVPICQQGVCAPSSLR